MDKSIEKRLFKNPDKSGDTNEARPIYKLIDMSCPEESSRLGVISNIINLLLKLNNGTVKNCRKADKIIISAVDEK